MKTLVKKLHIVIIMVAFAIISPGINAQPAEIIKSVKQTDSVNFNIRRNNKIQIKFFQKRKDRINISLRDKNKELSTLLKPWYNSFNNWKVTVKDVK